MAFTVDPQSKQATGSIDTLINVTDDVLKHSNFKITPEVFYPGDKFRLLVEEYYTNLAEFRGYENREVFYSDVQPTGIELKPQDYLENLAARYKLDGDLLDDSGNGNNGTINYSANFVSWWKFEDNLTDEIGTQNLTLVAGTETYVNSPFGKALDFDGSTYYHANDASYDREISDPFSVEFWMKTSTDANMRIFSKRDGSGAGYQIQVVATSGILRFVMVSGTTDTIDSSTAVNDGNWHHIAVTFAGNSDRSGMKIYVDGVLETTGGASAMSGSMLNNVNFAVGAASDGTVKYTGQINHGRFYKSELTANQVTELYRKNTKTNFDNGIGMEAFHPIAHEKSHLPNDIANNDDKGSVSFWARIPEGTMNSRSGVFTAADSSSSIKLFIVGVTDDGKPTVQVRSPNNVVSTTNAFNDGQWHFVTVTTTGSAWKIFVDGVDEALTIIAGSNDGNWLLSQSFGTALYAIGVTRRSTGDIDQTEHQIQDVRLYDVEFDINRHTQVYNATKNFYDPILWLKFEDNLNDSSSLGNNFALVAGNELYDLPQVGTKSARFDGSTYHNFAQPDNQKYRFHKNQPFSKAFWIKTTDSLVAVLTNGSAGEPRYEIIITGTNKLRFELFNSSGNRIQKEWATNVNDDVWHHCLITYNGNADESGINLYMDGKLDNGTVDENTLTSQILSTKELTVGARNDGSVNFNGLLDELKIWNYELNADEALIEAGRKVGSIYIPMTQGKRYRARLQDLSNTPRTYHYDVHEVS
ncbi:MAG: hypothetical protein GWN01_01425 [Nitrosopumilaceae archaeon]|nr:LamG domain-containing protein [Nitrosopumilaceae archaeon]NIU86019.1 hypothetical protein [Nitrosopumilaceae archaeon]NIX60238.1 hypothetical protein [Nitrosopumilaceae archaeon]